MKKQYVSPAAELMSLEVEGQILAGSLVKSSETIKGADGLSNEKTWGASSIWEK